MSMTIQKAIQIMQRKQPIFSFSCADVDYSTAYKMALDALREKAEREDPKPLTIEELRQYEGQPVFLVIENIGVKTWAILDVSGDERTRFQNGVRLLNEVYGMTWQVYRHKPKEVSKDG